MRFGAILALGIALAGCTTTAAPVRKPLDTKIPANLRTVPGSLEGQSAESLIRMFGTPILDAREMQGRKLQFGNAQCVLDAFLYPKGRGEAVVIHVDTRNRQGETVETNSCITALTKR